MENGRAADRYRHKIDRWMSILRPFSDRHVDSVEDKVLENGRAERQKGIEIKYHRQMDVYLETN